MIGRLKRLAARSFGCDAAPPGRGGGDDDHEVERLRATVADLAGELAALTKSKAAELGAAWAHAHALDAALQRLDAFVKAGGHTVKSSGRAGAVLAHALDGDPPAVESTVVPDFAPDEHDVALAARLLAAYRRAVADEARLAHGERTDCWDWIRTLQGEFLGVLERDRPAELAEYLGAVARRDATVGIVQGHLRYDRICHEPGYRERLALQTKDKLVSLAEAVGAVPCENPEQGVWGRALFADVDELIAAIATAIGVPIEPPSVEGGLLALPTKSGLFCERDCHAIYTAWVVCRLLGTPAAGSVCEIGAGTGRVAHWSNLFGCAAYTILDLPHVNVVQGFYLLKSRPGRAVRLYGEPAVGRHDVIRVLPYFAAEHEPPRTFDLVLNQDSFPEIGVDKVRRYLNWIRSAARHFVSINHESKPPRHGGDGYQLSVPELVADVGGYRRVSRGLYWLRRGYVVELYELAPC
ncbi:MAG: putative sugar O-methyltransferase [Planctomycetes bacterium]|nr:putative sugar O-methyltransferase [Planctomycetota bacterium]